MEWINELLRSKRTRDQNEAAYDKIARALDWLGRSGYYSPSLQELTEQWVFNWMDQRDLIEALNDDAVDDYVEYLLTELDDMLERLCVYEMPDL